MMVRPSLPYQGIAYKALKNALKEEKKENMTSNDPKNPFSSNYDGTEVGPDSFGGTDEESHYMSHSIKEDRLSAAIGPVGPTNENQYDKQGFLGASCTAMGKIDFVPCGMTWFPNLTQKNNENHGWIQLYSGRKFKPFDVKSSDISIHDIAHSLSNMCRFTGHCKSFYSVAQHSVLVSHVVAPELSLCGLLHDASEAYLVDVPKPLKRMSTFDEYRKLEEQIQTIIFNKFGWTKGELPEVKKADVQLLATEARDLMSPLHPEWIQPCKPLPFTITPLEPSAAKMLFLERFKELMLQIDDGEKLYLHFMEE